MLGLNQTSIRRKMILAIMLTTGVALLLSMGVFLTLTTLGYRTATRRELSTLAAVLGEGASASLEFRYKGETERLLDTLRAHRNIVGAAIYDKHGQIFATYHREGSLFIAFPESPLPETSAFERDHLWLTSPVKHGEDALGIIYLRSDLAEFNTRLRWGLLSVLVITLFAGLAALGFAMRLGGVISDPILRLAKAARRVAEKKERGEPVKRETQDEVGTLVDSFNDMLDQLGERQTRLEEAQRMAHLGNWFYDPRISLFECSEEMLRILGLDPKQSIQSLDSIRQRIHPEDVPSLSSAAQKLMTEGTDFLLDHRVVRLDGAIRWVQTVGSGFLDASSNRVLRGTIMDITGRKHSEAAIRQAQKLESLGVLAGGIAHDFNNLLCAMQGNLGLARMDLPPGCSAENFLFKTEMITEAAAALARQMLAYSGKGRFDVKPLDLSRAVKEMGSLLNVSISKKAELRYLLDPEIPNIIADAAQIQQVVMNLVINASDALDGREGFIQIRTCSEDLVEADLSNMYAGQELLPGSYVVLEVQDNGRGMDSVTLERIFDPFFTTKFSGRGLGLAAMLGIVRGHKGSIKVYSEPGKGTTFKLIFPASEAPLPEVPFMPQEGRFQGSGLVMVVDDEAQIRLMASTILIRMGFEVIQAGDGREALELFSEHQGQVRMILLDLTMPLMDGAECLKAIRALDPDVKVLLSSGFSESNTMEEFRDQRLSGFVQKPYSVTTLMAKVKAALG